MDTKDAKEIIKQIAQEKENYVKGGGKDFQGALKGIIGSWSHPSHALIELLQNADDAADDMDTASVECKILSNGIIFEHNGHPFIHSEKKSEIRAICSIDNSTKDTEKHTGFMGIGFKAVFKLSDSPYVIGSPWQFRFCQGPCENGFDPGEWGWILIPRWMNSIPDEIREVVLNGKTVFWLPYKKELSEDAIKQIEGEIFEKFDSLCLRFLRHIKQIQIASSDGRVRKMHLYKDTVIEEKNGNEIEHRYQVFRNLFPVNEVYLFSWDEIVGNGGGRLIESLIHNFDVYWARTAIIDKIDDGKTINISDGNNFLSLRLNNEKTKLILTISDGKPKEFIAKRENGRLNIYKKAKSENLAGGRDKAKVREILLAFSLDSKGKLQLENSPLYTFLPTDYFTGLRFAVQSDFILDTARSRVDEGLEWNRWLWRCTKELLIDTIEGFTDEKRNHVKGFKEDDELRYQFYRVLPSKKDFSSTSEISMVMSELIIPFWNYCRENQIIITSVNTWEKPSDTVFTNLPLHKLLDSEKLKELTGRQYFVHPKVRDVKDFLKDVGVDDLDPNKFLEALKDEKWVNSKNIEWFSNLYAFLWNRLYGDKKLFLRWKPDLKDLKSLSIVRTYNHGAKKPDEVLFPPDNKDEIELATGIPGVFFVDNLFLEGNTRELLKNLGVHGFSKDSIIKSAILKGFEDGTWQNWTAEQYDKCVQFIREWLKERKWELLTDLQQRVGAVRVKTEGNALERADNCYFPEQELKLLYPDGNFIKLNAGDKEQGNFLLALGVKNKPRVFIEDKVYQQNKVPDFASRYNDYWLWLRNHREWNAINESIKPVVAIDGWDRIQISDDNALILLSFIAKNWSNYYKKYTESQYDCGHSTHSFKQVPSYLSWQLLETKWLLTTKGFMKTSETIFVPLPKIKKVAGDFVPYISIPSGYKDKEQEFLKLRQDFFKFLGLRSKLDMEALKYILRVAQEHSLNGNLKLCLSHIYQEFGKFLEENESELGQLNLLAEDGAFKDPATTTLYWNDDRDLGKHFQQAKGISFAWIPDNVERRYIDVFFQKARIKALSKYVQRKLVTSISGELNEKLTSSIREKARYIYSLLKHHKADKASDNAGSAKKMLSNIQVMSLDKIEVFLSLDGVEKIVFVNAFYAIDSDIFYLTRYAEDFERSLELARVFGLDFGYISDIEVVFREDNKKIEDRFQRQGITLLDWQPVKSPSASAQKKGDGQDKNNRPPIASQFKKITLNPEPGDKVINGGKTQREKDSSQEITDEYPSEKITTTITRRVRDTALSNEVKEERNYQCQICGNRLSIKGKGYAETHHVKGLNQDGPDIKANMLVLCPNHHVLFDYGEIAISPEDCKTVVDREGSRIFTLIPPSPEKEYIEHYYNKIYKK